MHFSKHLRVVIGAFALSLGAGVAFADEPASFPECGKTPSADDVEAAKQSHLIATSRFNLQDWDKAIEFWRQAYSFDCTAHPILENIANAYEKKGDKKNAITALETYLSRAPGAPNMVKINERVIELKKSMEPAKAATATATVAAVTSVTAAPTTTASAPSGPRPFGVIPLIAAGAGGVIALAGAIMIPVGLGPYNTALEDCPNGCSRDVADAGNTGRILWNTGGAFLGVGLAVALGGVGFHFLFNKPSATAEKAAAPSASPSTSTKPSGAPPAGPASPPPAPKAQIDVLPLVSPGFGGLLITGKF